MNYDNRGIIYYMGIWREDGKGGSHGGFLLCIV